MRRVANHTYVVTYHTFKPHVPTQERLLRMLTWHMCTRTHKCLTWYTYVIASHGTRT